jgi:serine protease Do
MKRLLFVFSLGMALAGAGSFAANRALVYANSGTEVPKDLVSYKDVVKRVLPAVVSVDAKPKNGVIGAKMPSHPQMPFGNFPGLPEDLRKELERFQKQQPQMPDMAPRHAFGSGFVVDPTGVIFTNDHVVHGADEVQVTLQDGRKFTSRDIKKDPKTDLAIVRIEVKEPLPSLKLGDSDKAEIGDRVLAIGAPLGLTGSVTSGIISAKGRDIHMNMYEDFLQTDAAINPGNSGGPLVNLAGEVVGINSAIKSETGGFQGIGLAISSNLAKNVMEQLLHNGSVHRSYLGVQVQALDAEVAARLGMAGKSGVVLSKVMPGGPAAKCGLQDGDILTEIAGQQVKDPQSLRRIVAGLPLGKPVELTVFHDGNSKKVTMTAEEQPESFGTAAESTEAGVTNLGKVGVKITDLTPEKARELGYPQKTEGVLITEVEPNSVAGEAGLRSGTLLLKVDQQLVKNAAEAQQAVEKASLEKGVLLQVRTAQGGTFYVLLKSSSAH